MDKLGDVHLKRQMMGREVIVVVTGVGLDFGLWKQIFYGEFDGGRRKRVLVKINGEQEIFDFHLPVIPDIIQHIC